MCPVRSVKHVPGCTPHQPLPPTPSLKGRGSRLGRPACYAPPMPPALLLQDISLTFGTTPLLTGAGLAVAPGDRVCLVGRNGSGKSTLLRIAAGLMPPDAGRRFVQPGATIRYLPQEPDLSGFATTLAYVEAGLVTEADADRHRARYLLEQLGLTGDEPPATLSGGEARRAALARVLAPSPDILLLDEPTNHLDLPGIEWLEQELAGMRSGIVLISHDRRLLERISRATVWLDRGITRTLDRGFAAFEAWRDAVLEQEETDRHKLGRKIVMEEDWLRYGVTARRKRNVRAAGRAARAAQAATRAAGRAGHGAAGDRAGRDCPASWSWPPTAWRSPMATGRSCGIFPPASCAATGSASSGPNGAGKTTLLNLLTGALAPDAGDGEARHQPRTGDAGPAAGNAGPGADPQPDADRRRRRHGDGRRAAPARGRLHEGLPVRAGTGEHPGRRAVRRRARPADPGARLRPSVQPAGAGRADQRPGPGDAGPAAGAAGRLCRHRAAGQPRPRFPRPRGDLGDRRGGRRALDRIRRRLLRHAGAARAGGRATPGGRDCRSTAAVRRLRERRTCRRHARAG